MSGVTQTSDIYGPGCTEVPTEGEGSAQGMVDDPVGTAAGNNPLLSTLATAVAAANLGDTLNDTSASYTVFAPANSAFESLPPGTLDSLLADPSGQLTDILTYHVVPQRYDAQGLADAGTVATVQGESLTITGEPMSLTIDEQEQATVLCGNIPTANATVFVIDTVLMPPAA
ncbi:fasciclin domain-containing protein [Pseudonocardia oceani]|nr:fasciclin domain-containing protein [Pseudonocardia oceani]